MADFRLISHKAELMEELQDAIEKGLEECGITAERYAKEKSPVDTGNLRNSITHEVRMDEKAVYIGSAVEYSPYVEMGTSKMKAHPYLKPALEDHINTYKKILESNLKTSVSFK